MVLNAFTLLTSKCTRLWSPCFHSENRKWSQYEGFLYKNVSNRQSARHSPSFYDNNNSFRSWLNKTGFYRELLSIIFGGLLCANSLCIFYLKIEDSTRFLHFERDVFLLLQPTEHLMPHFLFHLHTRRSNNSPLNINSLVSHKSKWSQYLVVKVSLGGCL